MTSEEAKFKFRYLEYHSSEPKKKSVEKKIQLQKKINLEKNEEEKIEKKSPTFQIFKKISKSGWRGVTCVQCRFRYVKKV